MKSYGTLILPALFRMESISQMRPFVYRLNYQSSLAGLFFFNPEALEPDAKFSHIIEIIENNEPAKQLGREKYKHIVAWHSAKYL